MKLRFWCKNNSKCAIGPPMVMPMDYHVWGAMLEHYQIHMPKLTNIMLS